MSYTVEGTELTVGEIINALKQFDKDSRVCFMFEKSTNRAWFYPRGTGGNYNRQYHVLIEEGSYQNTVYFEVSGT